MFEIDAPKAAAAPSPATPRQTDAAPPTPVLSADLPSTLRYAESPIQRRTAINGISAGENEAVKHLSGGRSICITGAPA